MKNNGSWCPECYKARPEKNPTQRGTIEEMRELARSKEGECLSPTYTNSNDLLWWKCKNGHKFQARPNNIVSRGSWCKKCGIASQRKPSKHSLSHFQSIAAKHDGACLSSGYKDCKQLLDFQCKQGHKWTMTGSSAIRGSWCPECAAGEEKERRIVDIALLRALAHERGGECLSNDIVPSTVHVSCGAGHEWDAFIDGLVEGNWCLACGKERMAKAQVKYTIEDVKKIAEERGGECLSTGFVSTSEKLRFKCAAGHEWDATLSNVLGNDKRKGTWCPECAHEDVGAREKTTLESLQAIARSRGGVCLSSEYVNAKEPMLWRCAVGHEWHQRAGNIKAGTWCKKCAWKANKPAWTGSMEKMREIAEARGGHCLSLRYINSKEKLEWECKEGHQWKAVGASVAAGTWCPTCARAMAKRREGKITIDDIRAIVASKGGFLHTTALPDERLRWRCKEGHEWNAAPASILVGSWCQTCAVAAMRERSPISIQTIRDIAQKHGGECLSEVYENQNTKLVMRCENGHVWETSYRWLALDHWCPRCGGLKVTIEDVRELAISRGGECLSTEYENKHTVIRWRCAAGHAWESAYMNVRAGSWCPICANIKRTIDDARALARERGGECLSEVYEGYDRPLRWRCDKNHEWETTFGVVNGSAWCPVCGHRQVASFSEDVAIGTGFIIVGRPLLDQVTRILESDEEAPRADLSKRLGAHLEEIEAWLDGDAGTAPIYLLDGHFESAADIVGDVPAPMTYEDALPIITSIHARLSEASGHPTNQAVAAILACAFDTIDAKTSCEWAFTAFPLVGIARDGNSYILTESGYNSITRFIEHSAERKEEAICNALDKIYGYEFRPVVQAALGFTSKNRVVVVPDSLNSFDTMFDIPIQPEIVGLGAKIMIRSDFFVKLMGVWKQLNTSTQETSGKDVAAIVARAISKRFPVIRIPLVYNWLRGVTTPVTYDPFDQSCIDGMEPVMAMLASETSINQKIGSTPVRAWIGESNPVRFMLPLIPLVRHPSYDSNVKTLSPAFINTMKDLGYLDGQLYLRPIPFPPGDALDRYLAGLFDTRGHVSITAAPKGNQKQITISIELPYLFASDWLKLIPCTLPVDVGTWDVLDPGDEEHYAANLNISNKQYVVATIFGRRLNKDVYPDEDRSAREMIKTLRYFYEHVFPHCVHPRVELLLEAAWYIGDQYGVPTDGPRYPRVFREILQAEGGLDTRALENTFHEVAGEPSDPCHLFVPPWLESKLGKGLTRADLITAAHVMGGFEPYKNGFRSMT